MTIQADRLYEIGKLYCDRGDYSLALPNLVDAAASFLNDKKFDYYLKSLQAILRIHAQREEHEEINRIKENLHDLVIRESIDLSSKTFYTLGVCANYKGQVDSSVDYFRRALELGLKANSQEDMCNAILGLSICYRQQKRYDEALKEIYNLNIFLQVLNLTELKIASANSNARILMDLKKYDQALDVLWVAYDEIKHTKELIGAVAILQNIGTVLFELGQKDAAKIYLNLAAKTINPADNKLFYRSLTKYLDQIDANESTASDLVFDLEKHSVIEKNLGSIDFKNQFILLDLLKLFIGNQGQIFSKEYLVEQVWKQNYDPAIHDNKIYVTIKRLRKLIEPDYDKPKYIFRAKNGYYLNKTAKVELKEVRAEGAL
ncbi:MAG: winged helix-turn-helix domain-containing protein [Bdellovibrio sp.]|nr:winged helix-turn-helix domain-containing protein [Bdellovibrio sp.]